MKNIKYQVYLSTKIKASRFKKGSGIIVLEPEDTTAYQIKTLKRKGYKVLAYLSIGTLEKERPWWKDFKEYRLSRLPDWPKEFYVDVRKMQWREFIVSRAKALKKKGFSGWWCDNVDVYSEYKSPAMRMAIASLLGKLQKIGGYVMINGGSEWLDDMNDRKAKIRAYVDGYTQEEVFSRITDYDGKGKFGKQKSDDAAYYKWLIKVMLKKDVDCFCLEYTRDDKLKARIKAWCKEFGAGYYISEDVNL